MEIHIRIGGLVLHKGKLLLLKRSPLTRLCPNLWEAIHGKIHPNESEEQAVLREVQEETGLSVKIIKKGPVFRGSLQGGDFKITPYLLESDSNKIVLSEEHTNSIWINPKDYVKYCPEMKPELTAFNLI